MQISSTERHIDGIFTAYRLHAAVRVVTRKVVAPLISVLYVLAASALSVVIKCAAKLFAQRGTIVARSTSRCIIVTIVIAIVIIIAIITVVTKLPGPYQCKATRTKAHVHTTQHAQTVS